MNKRDVMELTKKYLSSSEHVSTLQSLKTGEPGGRLFGNKIRKLRPSEIDSLRAQGNRALDWGNIRVSEEFTPNYIFDSFFMGNCVLGAFKGKEMQVDSGILFPSGIYNSVISNAEIGNDCLIFRAGLLANAVVMDNAVIYETGNLICSEPNSSGNGRTVSVGIETGGREIAVFAELTIQIASFIALNKSDSDLQTGYSEFVKTYSEKCRVPFCVVESGALIRNTSRIENSFIGKACRIDGATLIENSTILSDKDEPVLISHGAFVRNSIIQWGCEVTSMGILDESVLTEHSHLERHGKVASSIIGPNTGIAEGEVTASLLGPFTGFHHQALLIAAVWPEGKGNIAYGANVGSNHTSKAPDQEIWCGEGNFFGLGCNIKFPSDFSRSPYSLFATAVCTLPQRIEFPFSLINTPSFHPQNLPPLHNEIFPGWVLYNNIYTVMRNEGKYIKRNKARRTPFIFDVFRDEIADLMVNGRDALKAVQEVRDVYTEKQIAGLGKNFLTEESRLKGIDSYNFYIEYYCLLSMKKRVEELIADKKADSLHSLTETSIPGAAWEHARKLLAAEGFGRISVKEGLERLIEMKRKIAADTESSKARDDERGNRIIDDYKFTHESASEDSFVKDIRKQTEELKAEIEKIHEFL